MINLRFWWFSVTSIIAKWLIATSAVAGDISDHVHNSELLGRDLPYRLYTPQGFTEQTGRQALLLLHGYGGSAKDWLGAGQAGATLDRLIDEGIVPPMLLVLPSAGNSWYAASDAFGPMDQTLLEEFLPAISETHGIKRWSIAGLSMGGYGALRLGLMAPEQFDVIGAFSPAIFSPGFAHGPTQLKLFGPAFGEPFDVDRYERGNPFTLLNEVTPPPIYLSVGDNDYFKLDIGSAEFFAAAKKLGHEIEFRVEDAGHVWPFWQRQLPAMLRTMADHLN